MNPTPTVQYYDDDGNDYESRGILNSTAMTQYENYEEYYNFYYDYLSTPTTEPPQFCRDTMCVFLATVNVIIFVLGVIGNGLVIWIVGFKMKKSVNSTWYLSLAVSDFLFCAFLPFSIVYLVKEDWVFGLFMCKFQSFIMFLNMFSSIFLLVIISVDRCEVVVCPVWAQNERSVTKASVTVMLAWITSALLSIPSAIFQDVQEDYFTLKKTCFNSFINDEDQDHVAIVAIHFIFGFVIPFLIIITCYVLIIRKLKTNQMAKSKKCWTMTVVIVAFFICWLPFHAVALMELNYAKYASILPTGQVIGSILATVNSFLNPFLYAFKGMNFKRRFYAILSNIQSAIEEENCRTV